MLASSLDKSLKIFDILTGSLIDWVQFKNAPLSIDFSLSGEYLATTHVGSKAVFLWSNRAFFQDVVIQKVPTKPVMIDLPAIADSQTVKASHKDFYARHGDTQEEKQVEVTQNLIQQKFNQTKSLSAKVEQERQSETFAQMSNQPYSKWQAIFNLEQIKERNKPTLAKKEVPKAPFFLFDMDKVMAGEANTTPEELLKQSLFTQEQKTENKLEKHGFTKKLRSLVNQASAKEVIEYLKSLSPSGIELEFISLASFDFDDKRQLSNPNQSLIKMLEVFRDCLGRNQEVDFVQALLHNFFTNHYDVIVQDEELVEKVGQLKSVIEARFADLEALMSSNLCMTSYFAGINQF